MRLLRWRRKRIIIQQSGTGILAFVRFTETCGFIKGGLMTGKSLFQVAGCLMPLILSTPVI